MIRILRMVLTVCMCMRAISEHACVRIYSDSVQNFIVLRAYMVITRGSGRPACEEAAADAGYASGTWRRERPVRRVLAVRREPAGGQMLNF